MLILKVKNPVVTGNPITEAYKLYGVKSPTLNEVYNKILIKVRGDYYTFIHPLVRSGLVNSNNPLFNAYVLRSLLTNTIHSLQTLQVEKIHQFPPQSINEFVSDELFKLLLGLESKSLVGESFVKLFNTSDLSVAVERFVRSIHKEFDNFERFSRLVKSNNLNSRVKVVRLLSVVQGLVGGVNPIISDNGVLPFSIGAVGDSCVGFEVDGLGQFKRYSEQLSANTCEVVKVKCAPPVRFILFSNLYGVYNGEVVGTSEYSIKPVKEYEGLILKTLGSARSGLHELLHPLFCI